MSLWKINPPESDFKPPPESFLAKLRRLIMGKAQDKKKQRKPKQKSYTFGWCFIVLSAIFLVSTVGCIIMWFTDLYVDSILNQMILEEGTEIFEAWKNPPIRPLICVHIFNYTNMDDYLEGRSDKIQVNDTGPYCYRETLEKTNIVFYDDGTVSYGDRRTHVFVEANSTGSMNDTVIVPNLPLISAVAMGREMNDILQYGLRGILRLYYIKPMRKVQAHEFLFGYDDSFVSLIKGATKIIGKDIPINKFGILAMRAAETKERITVKTGAGDLNSIGVVTALNGETALSAWDDPECNRLDGSDGAFFPRHEINETAKLFLFHKDLCRKLPLIYEEEVDFQDGVMGMRFHVPPDVYNTNNTCYCKNGICPPPGVFDVSPCANGVPIMMSFPHFLNADSSVTQHLEGLRPDPKKHDFFIDINRILGFTLGTVTRIQVNIQIRKSDTIGMLDDFEDETILPVVWFEVTADRLPPDLFKMIYHASVTVQWIQWSLQWGFLAVLLSSGIGLVVCFTRGQKYHPVSDGRSSHMIEKEIIVERLSSV